ncbi:TPA: hypothetical protein HA251_00505 [Candidatus Woesearchaeota archaeon]|nr:hypothetical protein [Candidatus Woesearchaeota archaeon]
MDFRRKLYRRGSSFETTVPMPLLLTLDDSQQHDVIFAFDAEKQAWYIRFERREEKLPSSPTRKAGRADGAVR